MKRKLIFLLTAVVMALGLCMSAAAEPLQVSGLAQSQTGYLAGYDDSGRMVGVRILTADGQATDIPGATSYKLLRLDTNMVPQGEALAFTPDEGVVRKVDGQVCICYDGTEGPAVKLPVTEKLTGKVAVSWSNGELTISGTNGARYPATGLTVEGCAIPISADAFAQWLEYGSFNATYVFYLDASGAICWIEQLEDTRHQPCLPLAAVLEEGSLRVLVRMGVRTDVLTVTRLDGKAIGDGPDRISPADALAQLQGDCERAFYTYSCQAGNGGYHLVRASKDSPVDTGCAWGESYLIPDGSAIQPYADFSFGVVPCLADADTTFGLSVGAPGDKTFIHCRGFQDLPFAQARGCVITRPDGVADIVYLDVPYFVIEPPDGCILVADNHLMIDPEFEAEDVYRVNIMDTDGTSVSMRVSPEIADGVKEDRMEPDRFADNTYVGKLFRVTAMDQNGTVWGLRPVDTYEVQALGDGTITTAAGSWRYSPETYFIYADFVRELSPSELLCLSGHGSFNPNDFRAEDVGEGQLYSSVRAAVIPAADDETLARYVYVIRECN